MKKHYCAILWLLSSNLAWALDCAPPPNISIHHTEKMYPNSVLWLDRGSDEKIPPLILKSAQDEKTLVFTQPLAKSNIQKLQPEHPFKVKQNYILNLKEKSGIWLDPDDKNPQDHYGIWFSQDNLNLNISQSTQRPTLTWQQFPKLNTVNYKRTLRYGNSGSFSFKFKVNDAPENYLVLVHISQNKLFPNTQSSIRSPHLEQDGTHRIDFGFDICNGGIEDFNFDYGDKISVKFDLISHDGTITPWQGDPLVFHIKSHQSPINTKVEASEQSFFQKVIIWLRQFYSLFLEIIR